MGTTERVPTSSAAGETRVTGKRVVQYLVDLLLIGLAVYLVWYAVTRLAPGAGFQFRRDEQQEWLPHLSATSGGWTNTLALSVTPLLSLVVFALIPAWTGRTPGMALLGLRVVRTDGGRPSLGDHLLRWVFLLIDGIAAGLVGWIVILFSRRRQRIGDHAARTLVVRDRRPGLTGTAG